VKRELPVIKSPDRLELEHPGGPLSNRSFFSRKPLDGMMQALLLLCALVSTVSAQASACAVSSFMIRESGAALYIPGILWQSLRDECNLAI